MDLTNADGTSAEMSGNGIRCLVQAAVAAGWVDPGIVSVATDGGVRLVNYAVGDEPGLGFGRVDMGPALLGPDLPPAAVRRHRPRSSLRRHRRHGEPSHRPLGPPVDGPTVDAIGSRLERSVTGGANVEFAWPAPDADTLTMRVWEHGVGETLACGTGSCAVVAAAHHRGLVGDRVRVHNRGGTLEVELRPAGIFLAGPTQKVADVLVDADVLQALVDDDEKVTSHQ